jgi:hypothetical protein
VSTQILENALEKSSRATFIGPVSRYVNESREALLVYDIEELAALRFSIILTARWASSDGEEPERRAELRADLRLLRKHYGDKIDEMAMTFGVEQAMRTQEDVERTVILPREIKQLRMRSDEAEGCDEEPGI